MHMKSLTQALLTDSHHIPPNTEIIDVVMILTLNWLTIDIFHSREGYHMIYPFLLLPRFPPYFLLSGKFLNTTSVKCCPYIIHGVVFSLIPVFRLIYSAFIPSLFFLPTCRPQWMALVGPTPRHTRRSCGALWNCPTHSQWRTWPATTQECIPAQPPVEKWSKLHLHLLWSLVGTLSGLSHICSPRYIVWRFLHFFLQISSYCLILIMTPGLDLLHNNPLCYFVTVELFWWRW